MNRKYSWCSSVGLLLYILILSHLWRMCRYGGFKRHLVVMIVAGVLLVICMACWLVWYRMDRQSVNRVRPPKGVFLSKLVVFILATAITGAGVFYAAIPYNGALSWKIDELFNQKKVRLEHHNLFSDGGQGFLTDLDKVLGLPDVLYTSNTLTIDFNGDGEITQIYAFLYGKDENGETRTYLIDYASDQGDKMTVYLDGYSGATYAKEQSLTPLLTALSGIDWTKEALGKKESYRISYGGRQSFTFVDRAKLKYIAGDVDGDGTDSGNVQYSLLDGGGAIEAYGMILQKNDKEHTVLADYIMEPVYISAAQQSAEAEDSFIEEAQTKKDSWSVDASTGTMYDFLDEQTGWRLVVADAAAGSRYYVLEQTTDGGATWEQINDDPFGGNIGVAEGLLFFDTDFGIAGLGGASADNSTLYLTKDGGKTFTALGMPMDQVTELPALGQELGYSVVDYDYMQMPEGSKDALTVTVTSAATETSGLVFTSADQGETWQFAKVKEE